MADIETTVSAVPLVLIRSGLNLINASKGIYYDTAASISGAVSNIDFAGEPIKRLTVTGNLSGSFANPPLNPPELADNGQSIVLTVIFIQDGTGGRQIPLDTLFANYFPYILGAPIVDESAGGITVVDIVARRSGGVVNYTVNFSPTFDASQIDTGILDSAVLPQATDVVAGVVALAPGSGSAARGDHTHYQPLPGRITITMSGGGAIPNGDYPLVDMPSAGRVIRLTGMRVSGATGSTPTATVSMKIAGATVTGTGISVNTTASGDANATANNTFVARQILQVNVASVSGSPTLLEGFLHYALVSEPWTV